METPKKDRQQKLKKRQAADGKKAVTVRISAKTKKLIDQERKMTGETIADVIDRAVDKLFGIVTSDRGWARVPPTSLTCKQKAIIKEVSRKHSGLHFDPFVIAGMQNKGRVPTLTGAEQWDESEVQLILDYLEEHDLGMKLHLLKKSD
jgi:hypothetical protein